MRLRKILVSAVAAVMVVGGVSLTVAPVASAASFTIEACQQGNFTVLDGDTVVVVISPAGDGVCEFDVSDYAFIDFELDDPDRCYTIVFGAGTTLSGVGAENIGLDIVVAETATIGSAVTAVCGPDPAPNAAPPIPAWVQAYGRASQEATCLDGWSPSWQSWAEPVTGGWVCTRSIASLG